jgi:hypothetical protein
VKVTPWDHCADCGELVTQGERLSSPTCFYCRGRLHVECLLTTEEGEATCEDCLTAENTRYSLVMSRGAGEGRDPIEGEDTKGYEVPLETSGAIVPWFSSLAALEPDEEGSAALEPDEEGSAALRWLELEDPK